MGLDEAVDGGLQRDQWDAPRFSRRWVSLAKKVSIALSQEHEVDVKWKTKRGWRASQRSTLVEQPGVRRPAVLQQLGVDVGPLSAGRIAPSTGTGVVVCIMG